MKYIDKKRNLLDLLGWPVIGALFSNQWLILLMRLAIFGSMILAIYFGLVYTDQAENPFTKAIFWSLFWPFFIIASLATLGPVFCGVCPHSFIGSYLNKYGLKKPLPRWIKNNRWIGTGILVLCYWLPVYSVPGITKYPAITASFFLSLTIFSWFVFFLYKNMAYCAHLCPIGGITSAFGKVSFASLGTDERFCKSCKTFDCAKSCQWHQSPFKFNSENSIADCRLCMDCVQACNAVEFKVVKPSSQLWKTFAKKETFSIHIYIFLLAIITITMNFRHSLEHSVIKNHLPWVQLGDWMNREWALSPFNWSGVFSLLSALTITLIIVHGSFTVSAMIARIPYKQFLYTVGPMLAPLMIIGLFAHVLSAFFHIYASDVVNALYWLFDSNLKMEPLAERGGWASKLAMLNYLAIAWAVFILYKQLKSIELSKIRRLIVFIISGSMIWFYLALLVLRVVLPRG